MAERPVSRAGDLLSLLIGVLALLGAVLVLLSEAGRLEVEVPVVLGALVIAAGVVGAGSAGLALRR